GPQAHVQRVRGAGRHGAHLPAIHGALPLRSAAEHPARPRAGRPEPWRLVHHGLLAHRVSALAPRDLRGLPARLRARRQLVRDSGTARRFLVFPPAGLSLQWYAKLLNSEPFVRSFFFSLRLAALTTIITTIIGTAAALYVVRHARRKDGLRMLLVAPLQLPGIMTSLALL